MVSTTKNSNKHIPFQGHKTTLRVAYGAIKPNIVISSIAAGALAAKGATSITVTGVTQAIAPGNYLLFRDAITETEVLVEVTAAVASAGTSITVSALEAAISSGSIAHYPPEILDRTAADFNSDGSTQTVVTLNTEGRELVVTTSISESISAPGNWHHWNPGLKICEKAFGLMEPVWVMLEYQPPTPNYSRGEIILGRAVVSSASRSSPADNFLVSDIELPLSGASQRFPAELTP